MSEAVGVEVVADGEQEHDQIEQQDGEDGQEEQYIEYHEGQEYHEEGQVISEEGMDDQQQQHEMETQIVDGQDQEQQYQEYHIQYEHQEGEEGIEGEHHEGMETQIIDGEEQYQEYQVQYEHQVQEGGEEQEHQQHEMETQIIDGNAELDQNAILDLIAFHSFDAEGNIIADVGGVQVEGADGTATETEHVQTNVEMSGEEQEQHFVQYVDANHQEEIEEHGEAESEQPVTTATESSSYLNIQEAIFNPNTGTLEPIRTSGTTNETTTSTKAVGRTIRKPAVTGRVQKRGKVQSQAVKFMITGEDGQPILLDAQALQGLLKGGGGNTITFSSPAGKNVLIAPKTRPTSSSRSPAKILPAPVPVGDQQQAPGMKAATSAPAPRYMIKQGNVLTPISAAIGQSLAGSPSRILQVSGAGGTNQVQYVRLVSNKQVPSNKIPIAPSRPKQVIPRPPPGGQTIFSLPTGSSSELNSLQGSGLGNFVVLPSSYMMKHESNTPVPIRPAEISSSSTSTYNGLFDSTSSILGSLGQGLSGQSSGNFESFRSLLEPNGMRPRKPCNCTKSQCLKLYCDCFANGEFCHLCNCNNCFNNLNHEEERQKAIKLVLERNPGAFRPKIGKSSQTGEAHERRHNKGCNCRRSGCLKNYCECYEAKIFCSGICKCSGCKNCIENIPSGLPNDVGVEQHFAGAGSGTSHRQTLKDLAEAAEVRVQQQNQVRNKMKAQMQDVSPQNHLGSMVPPVIFRYPHGSISYEVVTSIVELLLAKAEIGERQKLTEGDLERLALEEFGDCLASVMELGTTVGHIDD